MPQDFSFDIVSKTDMQEVTNAIQQAQKELAQRFDFKGVTVELTQAKEEITLLTDDEYRAAAVKDLIESKAIRRNLSLKIFQWGDVAPAGGNKVRQEIEDIVGLPARGDWQDGGAVLTSAMLLLPERWTDEQRLKWETETGRAAREARLGGEILCNIW